MLMPPVIYAPLYVCHDFAERDETSACAPALLRRQRRYVTDFAMPCIYFSATLRATPLPMIHTLPRCRFSYATLLR